MLLVLIGTNTLNHALKKPQTKNQQKKIVHETVNFCLPNLTKPQKKFNNTTKCHNIFIIPLFLAVVSFSLIFYYLCGGTNLSLRRYCPLWEWAEEADATRTNLLNPILGRDVSHLQLISMSSQVGCTHQFVVSI